MPRASVSSPPPASAVTMILIGFLGKLLGPAARVSPGAARVSAPPRAVPRNLRLTSPCVTTAASVLGAGIMREERSEEHTSELHDVSISYAVFCLKKKQQ